MKWASESKTLSTDIFTLQAVNRISYNTCVKTEGLKFVAQQNQDIRTLYICVEMLLDTRLVRSGLKNE